MCQQALLFKDKINFKGPGGGGFDAHQDATAYATDKLASTHITAMVAIDTVGEFLIDKLFAGVSLVFHFVEICPTDIPEMGPLEFAFNTTFVRLVSLCETVEQSC